MDVGFWLRFHPSTCALFSYYYMDRPVSKLSHSQDADEVLLNLVQTRDEAALEMLYDSKSRLVYSLALRIVKNKADAEEITQEVFWRVWQKAAAFDPNKGSALAWLTTMTRRLAIDRTRSKQQKVQALEVSLDVAPLTANGGDRQKSGEDLLIEVAQRNEVVEAIHTLDDKLREVILLSYFEGLSHTMIADRLGIPLGTIKSRIRQAVGQLRKLLDMEETGEE